MSQLTEWNIAGKRAHVFAAGVEPQALEQFIDAMAQPFSVQGALMPDVHAGYSLPIGAVVKTDGVVLPSWVGYDIGCGMCAVQTTFSRARIEERANDIFAEIRERVPVGFKVHADILGRPCVLDPEMLSPASEDTFYDRGGFRALGTLGGGNHFIEIGYDELDQIWLIVHSGSRGPGHGIAQGYMKLASPDGKAREGHFGFELGSTYHANYMNDVLWVQEFALFNRKRIIELVYGAIEYVIDGRLIVETLINRNHNHVELCGERRYIHRKGATHAEAGMLGVIPGNMRDGSFIVKGLGNVDALCSSSHGAGRVLGRKAAKRELKVDDFREAMQGVTASVSERTLDESPMAYKSIFEVMELQKDLVEVLAHVKPIINVKG